MRRLIDEFVPWVYRETMLQAFIRMTAANIKDKLPGFSLSFKQDLIPDPSTVPVYDFDKKTIFVGSRIVRGKDLPGTRHLMACDGSASELETNVYHALCRMKHKKWRVLFVWHPFPRVNRQFEGLGAVLVRI